MKNFLVPIFFFIISLSLYAQNVREAKIFVPPVTGIAFAEETAYFYRQLSQEVLSQTHSIVRLKGSSDFTLVGTIKPFSCMHDPMTLCPMHPADQHSAPSLERIFHLELIDTKTDKVVGQQYIVYSDYDPKLADMISILVYNMLSAIPDIITDDDDRSNWFFVGANVMWMPRIYIDTDEEESVHWLNFGFGLEAEFHFLNFLAVCTGLQLAQDWILIEEKKEEYHDTILEIPLALKFSFKPGKLFLLEPYAGVSYNFSTMLTTVPSLYSWFAGLEFGIKAGPGFITIDPRYSADILVSDLSESAVTPLRYNRYMLQFAIGYKFGLGKKYKINY